MTDPVIDHVKQNTAMLEGFLNEAISDFGRGEVLSKLNTLKNGTFDLSGFSESDAAHAARILTCLSTLSVISEDVANLGREDTFEASDGTVQTISLANAVASARKEGIDQARARLLGLDHIVNVTTFRGDVGAGEFLTVFRDELGFLLNRVICLLQLLAENDVYRAVRSHDRDLGRGPGQVEVTADVL